MQTSPTEGERIHYTVPWYVQPMKMGVVISKNRSPKPRNKLQEKWGPGESGGERHGVFGLLGRRSDSKSPEMELLFETAHAGEAALQRIVHCRLPCKFKRPMLPGKGGRLADAGEKRRDMTWISK